MSVFTVQAVTLQSPDPNFGTDGAVTTQTAGGHAASQVIDTGPGAPQNKSARWSAYALVGLVKKFTVKFDWAINPGGVDTDITLGGTANADASFDVTLSVDGGATFPTSLLSRSASISGNNDVSLIESGSVSFDISSIPAIGQIQIRDRLHANATTTGGGSATASVTATISNLRLEVATHDPPPVWVG